MGFRPSAKLFYGMPIVDEDDPKIYDDYQDECDISAKTGTDVVFTGSEEYNEPAIAIKESMQSIDWDDGFAPLCEKVKEHITRECLVADWNEQLKAACQSYGVSYNESKCGWYLSSYYG